MNLRKVVVSIICIALLFNFYITTVYANENATIIIYDGTTYEYTKFPDIYIDGQQVKEGVMPPIITSVGRTLVPVREVFETIGAEVLWNGAAKEVYILYKDDFIVLKINDYEATVNGQPITMDETAKLVVNASDPYNAKTMVPLRFILETLNYEVIWEQEQYAIHIFSKSDNKVDEEDNSSDNKDNTDKDKDTNQDQDTSSSDVTSLPTPLKNNPVIWTGDKKEVSAGSNDIKYSKHSLTKITGINNEVMDGEFQYIIQASSEISGVNTSIWNDGLILDIENAEKSFSESTIPLDDNPYFTSIRSSQYSKDPMITRIVFDMKYDDINYNLELSQDRTKLILKVDRNYVYDIQLKQDDISDYVDITSTLPPVVDLFWLSNPVRLVIDVPYSDSAFIFKEAEVDGQYISSIRTSQFDEDTVRIVLEIKDNAEYTIENIESDKIRVRLIPPTYKNIDYRYVDEKISQVILDKKVPGISKDDFIIYDDYLNDRAVITITTPSLETVYGSGTIHVNDDVIKDIDLWENENGYNIELFTKKIRGYTVTEDENNFYINIVRPQDAYDSIVVIDAGHGGTDPGKPAGAGNYVGLDEKVVNLDLALRLEKLFDKQKDIKIYMTRVDDVYPTLYDRTDMANEVEADLFISIHNNAFFSSYQGMEILHFGSSNSDTIKIAQVMNESILAKTGTGLGKIKYRDDLHVLKKTQMPAILVEVAYMTNPDDAARLKSEQFKQNVVIGMYNGIIKSLETLKK